MGLFGEKRGTASKHSSTTIISEGANLSGELNLTGNVQIDGNITGTIRTSQAITISPLGSVEGQIFADKATINGHFEGEVYAKSVEILPSGYLKGTVTSAEFTIIKGGSFLGTSNTVSSEEVAGKINTGPQQKKELSIVSDSQPKKVASA